MERMWDRLYETGKNNNKKKHFVVFAQLNLLTQQKYKSSGTKPCTFTDLAHTPFMNTNLNTLAEILQLFGRHFLLMTNPFPIKFV